MSTNLYAPSDDNGLVIAAAACAVAVLVAVVVAVAIHWYQINKK